MNKRLMRRSGSSEETKVNWSSIKKERDFRAMHAGRSMSFSFEAKENWSVAVLALTGWWNMCRWRRSHCAVEWHSLLNGARSARQVATVQLKAFGACSR